MKPFELEALRHASARELAALDSVLQVLVAWHQHEQANTMPEFDALFAAEWKRIGNSTGPQR